MPSAVVDSLCAKFDPSWRTEWRKIITRRVCRRSNFEWDIPEYFRKPLTDALSLLQNGIAGVEIDKPWESNAGDEKDEPCIREIVI